MPLLSFDEPQPKLNPPISCWREDMPENHEPQLVPPQLRWLATRNDIYLEVPRYGTDVIWGGMIITATLMLSMVIFFIVSSILSGFYVFIIIAVVASLVLSFLCFLSLKMYFIAPRNQPIRLNRKRQKIYLFDYNRSRLPWLKWPVTITSYSWADVYGEISFSPTPGTRLSGLAGLNEGLAILQMLVTRQWGIMWPQPVHARMEILAGFSQRLQAMLRTFALGYVDLPQVYQAERHLNAVLEVLARLELKNASQMSELYTFMHNASIRLENTDANRDDITAAVLPASCLNPAALRNAVKPFVNAKAKTRLLGGFFK